MTNPFAQALQEEYISNPDSEQTNPFSNPFAQALADPVNQKNEEEEEEGFWKSSLRSAMQVVQGIAETTGPGLAGSFWQFMAMGELDHEEMDHLKQIYEREGVPFDESEWEEAREKVLGMIPTVRNIASAIEEKTGFPLEPKTRFQKGVRFLTEATRLSPEGATLRPLNVGLPKPALGAGLEATREVLKEIGIPEPFDEILSFAMLKQPPEGAPRIEIGKKKKPSGMTERHYQDLEVESKVTPEKIEEIRGTAEKEFRDIANDIIEKSPVGETYSELKANTGYKEQSREAFKEVAQLAEDMPEVFSTKSIKEELAKSYAAHKQRGYTPSEYTKSYRKFLRQAIKDTKTANISTKDLVDQFRENNKSFSEIKEPGRSFEFNKAKRDALQEHNRIIADMIEKEFPNSEFANLFKSSNENWKKIMDVEAIEGFMDNLFDGKIDFKVGDKFFEKKGMTAPFERALGKEGFKDFKQLMNDLMSTEQAHKLMKKAHINGYKELSKNFLAYIIHPKVGIAKSAHSAARYGQQKLWEMMLNRPKYAVTWHKGIENLKKGNYAQAQQQFEKLQEAEKAFDPKAVKPSEIVQEGKTKIAPKEVETLEAKAEKIQPERKTEKSQTQEKAKEAENITEAFAQMGSGVVDNLYNGLFDSLQKGKNTFAGIKDPVLAKAKPYYDAGLIKNPKDLRDFTNDIKPFEEKLSKQKKPESSHENFQKRLEEIRAKQPPAESKKPEKIELEHKSPKKKKKEKIDKDSDWLYTREDFPTKKEAIDYLHHLEMSHKKAPEGHKATLERDIENLKELVQSLKKKTNVKTDSPKKVDQKIEHAAEKPDITKTGLQKQKKFILDKVDDVIKNPQNYEETIKIDVPGDGKFTTYKMNIDKFKETIENKWPEKSLPSKELPTYRKKPISKGRTKKEYEAMGEKIKKEIMKYEKAQKKVPEWKEEYKAIGKKIEDLKGEFQDLNVLWRSTKD